MSKDLAKLVVRLEAESSRLQTQLEKSNNRLKKWENKANKSVDGVKRAFIGLASAASVLVFARMAKNAIDAADSIAKTADAVGLSTKAYQKFAFAADLAGVDQSQLNSNLTAFVKRVGEARAGTGPLVSFLQKYDKTLLQSIKNTKSQEEAFYLIAEATKKAKFSTEEAAIQNSAFSRAGVGMVNMMRKGAAGLQEMGDKAEKLGIILEDSAIRKAEEAKDQLTIMATVIKNNVIKQLIALSPQIIAIGNAFADALPHVTAFIEKFLDVETVGTLTAKLEGLNAEAARTYEHLQTAQKGGWFNTFLWGKEEDLKERLAENYQAIAETVDKINAKRFEPPEAANEDTFDPIAAAQERNKLLIDEEIRHADELRTVWEKSVKDREKLEFDALSKQHKMWLQGSTGKLKVIGGVLGQVSNLMQSENKKQFEIGKKAAIAQTIISTYTSAVEAFKALAGIPVVGPALGATAAAAAVTFGLSQVSAIKSQSFGGGTASVGVFPASPNTGLPSGTPGGGDIGIEAANEPLQINIYAHDASGFDKLLRTKRSTIVQMVRDAQTARGRRATV